MRGSSAKRGPILFKRFFVPQAPDTNDYSHTVPAGRVSLSACSRHFVPGYLHLVPSGQADRLPTASASHLSSKALATEEARRALGVVHFLRRYAIFLVLAALILFFQSREPAFLRINNLLSVLQSVAVVALLGIGVTVTLAVDGFDLSVGSIAAFTLMLTSYALVVLQFSAAQTVALALLTGAIIGLVNGLLIVWRTRDETEGRMCIRLALRGYLVDIERQAANAAANQSKGRCNGGNLFDRRCIHRHICRINTVIKPLQIKR